MDVFTAAEKQVEGIDAIVLLTVALIQVSALTGVFPMEGVEEHPMKAELHKVASLLIKGAHDKFSAFTPT